MADDYGSSTFSHGFISTNQARFGSLEDPGDRDWFEIYLESGQTYRFDLLGSDSGNGSLGDPLVRLYNSSGAFVDENDDAGVGLDSQLDFRPSNSGYYYVEAAEFGDNGTGTYRLTAKTVATQGDDVLYGTSGADTIDALGGDDLVFAGGGNDIAGGNTGDDSVYGEGGDDRVNGSFGSDYVDGGAGNDNVRGGPGRDFLNGGSGRDNFDFDLVTDSVTGANRDLIYDFLRGTDDVDVGSIDANVNLGGNQKFAWIDGANFTRAGQLREYQSNGDTIVAGSTDGDRAAEFEIALDGRYNLAANDFVL